MDPSNPFLSLNDIKHKPNMKQEEIFFRFDFSCTLLKDRLETLHKTCLKNFEAEILTLCKNFEPNAYSNYCEPIAQIVKATSTLSTYNFKILKLPFIGMIRQICFLIS